MAHLIPTKRLRPLFRRIWQSLGLLVGLFWFSLSATAGAEFSLSTLTIQTPATTYSFFTEVAVSQAAKAQGLMFRQSIAPDHAMLFDFNPPQKVQMWMKDTLIPLDMIFVRSDGSIISIVENAKPGSLDVIGVAEPVADVIEVAGGLTRKLGIHAGDHVGGAAFTHHN
jgi:uncharacterized membrane protein (UPF0127 family)